MRRRQVCVDRIARTQFYAELKRLAGLDEETFGRQHDQTRWPEMKDRMAQIFKAKSRDEWCELMEHSDVCFAPVLSMEEATRHPHNVARKTFIENGGMTQAAPAPRFSRTGASVAGPAAHPGQHTDAVLTRLGFDAHEVAALRQSGAIA